MKKYLALILMIGLMLPLFGCNNSKNSHVNERSTVDVTNETEPATEPNPSSDFEYSANSLQSGILIEKYIGSSNQVIIPAYIDGLPVISLRGVPDAQQPTAVSEGVFEGQSIQTITIPETVSVIGYNCFKDNQNLRLVTIRSNSSLTYISDGAFENCVKIENIDLSSTQVKEIGSLAFRGCTNLKDISFSRTLETIGDKAFYECASLQEVDFPESLIELKVGAFGYCTSLKKIEIPANVDLFSLSEPIFYDVPSIEKIVFKDGRESITGYALILTDANVEVVVPASVKTISPLPFFVVSHAQITISFLGNAPATTEDENVTWLEDAVIRYDPETTGWETFAWKDRCEMQPIQN